MSPFLLLLYLLLMSPQDKEKVAKRAARIRSWMMGFAVYGVLKTLWDLLDLIMEKATYSYERSADKELYAIVLARMASEKKPVNDADIKRLVELSIKLTDELLKQLA